MNNFKEVATRAMVRDTGLTYGQCKAVLNELIDSIVTETMDNGASVKIPLLGVFTRRDKKARTGQLIKSGVSGSAGSVVVPARSVLHFSVSEKLIDGVRQIQQERNQ